MSVTIGTSGYSYRHWRGPFYPLDSKQSEFEFFTQHFNSVELNNTFYGFPREDVVKRWYEKSPDGFTWSVKANQVITHRKNLNDIPSTLGFIETVSHFKEKLGPILFQLPPRWNINVERLHGFLEELPPEHCYAFEFRNRTWIQEEVTWLLKQYGASFCIYDFNHYMSPTTITSDTIYLRFHGPGKPYTDSYDWETLYDWADWAYQKHLEGFKVFCYFDNDNRAYAVYNAKTMSERLNYLCKGSNSL